MPLAQLAEPFDHEDWTFELKYDGFRALAHIEGGQCRLISRNRNTFKSFPDLCAGIGIAIRGQAVLDGEIVYLDREGVPRFYDLMRRRGPQCFYAFDLLWLDGRDLRQHPLLERKRLLRQVVKPPVLFANYIEADGTGLFGAVRERDLEGVVAKLANGRYEPAATSWVKIKNPDYSQAVGRADFFARKARDGGRETTGARVGVDQRRRA